MIVLLPLAPLSRSANRLHSSLFSNFFQRNFFNLADWHHNHGLDLLLLRLFHIEIILSRHLSRSRLIGFVSMALPFLKKLCNRIFLSIYLIQLLYLRFQCKISSLQVLNILVLSLHRKDLLVKTRLHGIQLLQISRDDGRITDSVLQVNDFLGVAINDFLQDRWNLALPGAEGPC